MTATLRSNMADSIGAALDRYERTLGKSEADCAAVVILDVAVSRLVASRGAEWTWEGLMRMADELQDRENVASGRAAA